MSAMHPFNMHCVIIETICTQDLYTYNTSVVGALYYVA